MQTIDYKTMKRPELRKACKAAGIKYGKLTVGGMRDTLAARVPKKVFGGNSVADEVAELDAAEKLGRTAGMGDLIPATTGTPTEVPTPTPKPVTGRGIKIEKDRDEQHGIKRPSVGGLCRQIWDWLDLVSAKGEAPTAKTVKAMASVYGWNPNNASIEFYQWRKFNGISGRTKKA